MTTWNILITDGLDSSGQEILSAAADVDDRSGISPEELIVDISKYHAVIVRGRTQITQEVFTAAVKLKVVGRAGVGVDNINMAAAQSNGVTVVNAPTASRNAVAELTLGLMLSLARHIPRADNTMKTGQWAKKDLKGVELAGKTLGIIGMGRIGSDVAKRAASFGMQIRGYDPYIEAEEIKARGANPATLDELYAHCDYISLHLPFTPETKGMLDGQAFAKMKSGVYLICAGRGGVIDETALLAKLESGQVAGAALDVFAKEPPGLSALVAHPHVVATPHIGAQTFEAQSRASEFIAKEVLAALNGEPLTAKIV